MSAPSATSNSIALTALPLAALIRGVSVPKVAGFNVSARLNEQFPNTNMTLASSYVQWRVTPLGLSLNVSVRFNKYGRHPDAATLGSNVQRSLSVASLLPVHVGTCANKEPCGLGVTLERRPMERRTDELVLGCQVFTGSDQLLQSGDVAIPDRIVQRSGGCPGLC